MSAIVKFYCILQSQICVFLFLFGGFVCDVMNAIFSQRYQMETCRPPTTYAHIEAQTL